MTQLQAAPLFQCLIPMAMAFKISKTATAITTGLPMSLKQAESMLTMMGLSMASSIAMAMAFPIA